MDRRQFSTGLSMGAALVASGIPALAQTEATTTKIIFPFAAGGAGDAVCRILAEDMRGSLKRTMLVENRTGANGLIGIKAGIAAAPDGGTILVTTGPTAYLLPMVEQIPSFDASKDLTPISLLGKFEFAIVAGNATGAKTFADLKQWLTANPDKAGYGVPSNGTLPHFAGVVIEQQTGIKMSRVAYRGGAPLLNDLAGGHMPFGIVALGDVLSLHQSGALKVVAVGSDKRSPFLPEVQTLREIGIPLVVDAWYGMWLPAATPVGIAKSISDACNPPWQRKTSATESRKSASSLLAVRLQKWSAR